ncbi:MAG: site-specific integrase [Porphyromonadaceae bacterium]|nr:site-specific integrase [Porphyromonadaceae bacterium]
MPKFQKSAVYSSPTVNFLPARLKQTKSNGWQVVYYALNPQTEKLDRVRLKLNRAISRYRTKREAMLYATEVVNTINLKLSGGWSPFFEGENARLYEKTNKVIQYFLEEKERELRENTMRSYKSFARQFLKWLDKHTPNVYLSVVGHITAVRFMDDSYKRKVNPRSYNNIVKMGCVFFNWCIEKGYSKQNPFDKIKIKKVHAKARTIIPADIRSRITEHLINTDNIGFALVLNLVYSSLIRPNEIRHIQIKHINLKEKYIEIPSNIAKNHNQRHSALSNTSVELLNKLKYSAFPKDYYLIGGKLSPSDRICGSGRFTKEWIKLRAAIKLPTNMQLYSLRDTGIYEMLKAGIDNLTVMQHADHHDLSTTTKYANHADKHLIHKINKFVPDF